MIGAWKIERDRLRRAARAPQIHQIGAAQHVRRGRHVQVAVAVEVAQRQRVADKTGVQMALVFATAAGARWLR
jgi:hypothetical protein